MVSVDELSAPYVVDRWYNATILVVEPEAFHRANWAGKTSCSNELSNMGVLGMEIASKMAHCLGGHHGCFN